MTDLKKLAEEMAGNITTNVPIPFFAGVDKSLVEYFQSALQKVRDETIDECANLATYTTYHQLQNALSEQIRSLKSKQSEEK